ncbi:MBL fold metallo-hydrolase [Sphingomonas bacterium]|uniref:MBL fold metallo-hydrolase n=1 Tax=Sphingomonas bacterium TaxID=1895847 RepID=UPI0015751698|nr:MBL fold metallo-hydrolase [Sphingomonas bacterium]
MLGSGTSSGVPRIGNIWGDCDPAEPRNRRTRASILVQTTQTTILVDTGPDMRQQLLDANVGAIDAVIWTHDHADHSHGIDDMRQLFLLSKAPIPGYARAETLDLLAERFGYVFEGGRGYPPTVDARVLGDDLMIGDIRVRVTDMPHGRIFSSGLRFDHAGTSIGYATDFHAMTPEMAALFAGVDVWVLDAVRRAPHPTHTHVAKAVEHVAALKPARAILTHMDQSLDYATLAKELPPGSEPGYDGLVVDLA